MRRGPLVPVILILFGAVVLMGGLWPLVKTIYESPCCASLTLAALFIVIVGILR